MPTVITAQAGDRPAVASQVIFPLCYCSHCWLGLEPLLILRPAWLHEFLTQIDSVMIMCKEQWYTRIKTALWNSLFCILRKTSIEFEAFVFSNSQAYLSITYHLIYHLSYLSVTTYYILSSLLSICLTYIFVLSYLSILPISHLTIIAYPLSYTHLSSICLSASIISLICHLYFPFICHHLCFIPS